MELIPYEEIRPTTGFNFAPMIDFLFLMLSLFATIAISKTALHDSSISLAEVNKEAPTIVNSRDVQQINLSISESGSYKWMTEFQEHTMASIEDIQKELTHQYQIGALSQDKSKTEVLLHIDQKAPWKMIAELIFAVKEMGFSAHPVYESR